MKMMRRRNNQKLHTNDRGAAMVIALIVSIVVIMFCVTALAVSYTLYASATKKVTQDQCRELAKSVSKELQSELTDVNYGTYQAGQEDLADSKNLLWHYLRYNVCQASWPYYMEEDETSTTTSGEHNKTAAYRYFTLDVAGGSDTSYSAYTDDISVCMYWENGAGEEYDNKKGRTYLYVKVTCTRGDESATITSKYKLNCTQYEEVQEGASGSTGSEDTTSSVTISAETLAKVDPHSNSNKGTIDTNEHWTWTFISRD